MAITLIKEPLKYTPSDNPIIFQVESDDPMISYFLVEVSDTVSTASIGFFNVVVTPDYPSGGFIDLSRILSNTVNWEVDNSFDDVTTPLTKPVLGYTVRLIEYANSGGATFPVGSPVTLPGPYYVFNANLDKIAFKNFTVEDYVVGISTQAKFLTSKPNKSIVNDKSFEQLCFLNDAGTYNNTDYSLVVRTYDSSNSLLNTYTGAAIALDEFRMFRLQVSPKVLSEYLLVDFTDVSYYKVAVENTTTQVKITEERTYYYQSVPCNIEPLNLVWVNSLGGIDSYQFRNIQETINYNRITYKKGVYKISDGIYTDLSGLILNPNEDTIEVNQEGAYEVTSSFISDDESYWLAELFKSKRVFMETSNYFLLPVMITNNSYQIQRQKYIRDKLPIVKVNFKMNGEIIPPNAMIPYFNEEMSETFEKNNCGAGYTGTSVVYTVLAGTYMSYTSQAAANQLAQDDIDANGQDYANAEGDCIGNFGNDYQSDTYTKNDCPPGSTPTAELIEVFANTFFSNSTAAANTLATNWIAANGQALANQNGQCIFPAGDIYLEPDVRKEPISGGYESVYVTINASAAVTDDIVIDLVVNAGGLGYIVQDAEIYLGDTTSIEYYLGDWLVADAATVDITGVTPNPDGAGTDYLF